MSRYTQDLENFSPPAAALSPPSAFAGSSAAITAGAAAGLAWNVFGAFKFFQSLADTAQSLMKMGMSAEKAAVYANYPTWMTVAFAIGVGGGLLGSALLLRREASAVPVFAISLLGYIALFIGDVTEGVFAAVGSQQVVILSTVLAIAAGFLAWSRYLVRRGSLR